MSPILLAASGPNHIGGLSVGSTSPVFLTVLAIHVAAGLTAAISGVAAALWRKGPGVHARLGRVYVAAIGIVFASALVLAGLRWPHDNDLAAIGTLGFTSAVVGYLARRRHWPGDTIHIVAMATSYVALLTAFYVDNGRQLPLWDRLPTAAYWLLPALIAAPLTVRAVARYRTPHG
jgi:uncharacterized membrane protein